MRSSPVLSIQRASPLQITLLPLSTHVSAYTFAIRPHISDPQPETRMGVYLPPLAGRGVMHDLYGHAENVCRRHTTHILSLSSATHSNYQMSRAELMLQCIVIELLSPSHANHTQSPCLSVFCLFFHTLQGHLISLPKHILII